MIAPSQLSSVPSAPEATQPHPWAPPVNLLLKVEAILSAMTQRYSR